MISAVIIAATLLISSDAIAAEGLFSKRIKGNGNKIIENRQSAMQFSDISVSTCVHLVISERRDGDILVRTDENIMPYVKMEVRNGLFRAWLENTSSRDMEGVRIDIEMPYNGKINEITASAASSVTVLPLLQADEVELSATGASRITANVRAKSLDIELSGASSANVTAECDELEISTTGASSVNPLKATCRSCDIEASGACKLSGTLIAKECEFDISGASKLSLSGSTQKANAEITGASKLDATDFTTDICAIEASGASAAYVHCTGALTAEASGSSKIGYSGNCRVNISSDSIFKR